MMPHGQYLSILASLYAVLWIALAIDPVDRADWALENALVLAFAAAMAFSYRRFQWSRVSYTLIFAFLCVHAIGAHYTYAKVPYDAAFEALFGGSLDAMMGWERNHFDRLAHFLYGLLIAYPVRELFLRVADARGFWGYFLPLDFTLATSAAFELFEWVAAEVFGGDLGVAYLGTQGDIWDAHRDMALVALGATIAMALTAFINIRMQRDFAREWRESLRVKSDLPLGEDEIARMLPPRMTADDKTRRAGG